jgi:hypothetical protein
MLGKKLFFVCLVVAALTAVAVGCQPSHSTQTLPIGTGNLHVLVLGADNGPLGGAKVISNEQPEGQLKVTGITGADGTVTYNNIKAGEYEFYVSRFDYEQKEFGVNVLSGQTTDFTITLARTPTPSPSAS